MIAIIFHTTLGLLMGFFIPGYAITGIFFKKYDIYNKLSLSFGLSMCLDIVLGLLLGTNKYIYTITGGVTERNVWFSLSIFSLFLLGFSLIKKIIRVKHSKHFTKIHFHTMNLSTYIPAVKKIALIVLVMLLIFITRFFLFTNDWYAGDSYEFKSLYTTNQIIKTGHVNYTIDLRDEPYKFYTGMIVDDLSNVGHSAFLAIITILSNLSLELLRRLSLTTVLLIFPLISIYQVMTKSTKFSLVYVLMALFFFECILLISAKTANITLAWYISLCSILLIINKVYKIRSYLVTICMQILLFLTYKTSAILLLPVLISISYGNIITNVIQHQKSSLIEHFFPFLKKNIAEILFTSILIASFFYYYTVYFPLIIRIFLEKLCGQITKAQFMHTTLLLTVCILLLNFIVVLIIYFCYQPCANIISTIRHKFTHLSIVNYILLTAYTICLFSLIFIYINSLREDSLLITSSAPNVLIVRTIELAIFFEILGIVIIFYKNLLTKKLNKLIFFWFLGSFILFPAWYIWGGIYGFILRTVQILVFPASLLVTNFLEHKINTHKLSGTIFLAIIILIIIAPTFYTFYNSSPLAKGSITKGEFYGIKWINRAIDPYKNLYSDLRIAGGIVPITDYSHIQLKGPNDSNGYNTKYEGTDFENEILNLWYNNNINPTSLRIIQDRKIDYIIHASSYFTSGIMSSNFYYKPLSVNTNQAFDSSYNFDKVYSNGALWIYKVNKTTL